jgi:O-antigen ligase
MVASTFLGIDIDKSVADLKLYMKGFLLAIVLAGTIKTYDDVKKISLYLLAGMVMGGLLTIYEYLTGNFAVSSLYTQRAGGLRADPNDAAMLLVTGVPVAIFWLLEAKTKIKKLFYITCLILLHVGIVLTASRGGFVALLFVYFLMYLRRPTIAATFAGIMLLIVAAIFSPQSYKDRILTLVSGQEKHGASSLDSRSKLLTQGLYIITTNPVTGVGPGNYGSAYILSMGGGEISKQQAARSSVSTVNVVAHNLYLEFFVENGLIGGGLFLAIIYISVSSLKKISPGVKKGISRYYPLGYMMFCSICGLLFAGLFLSQGKNSVLWFLIGVGLAAPNVVKRIRYQRHNELLKNKKHMELAK